MKILIVGLVNNSQLLRLAEEGKKRGHVVDGCYSSALVIRAAVDHFLPTISGRSLEEYDLIYLWAVGKRRWEWYTACLYLNDKYGTAIINSKVIDKVYNYYLASASDYLKQFENRINFPRSAVVFDRKGAQRTIDGFEFPLILKKSEGRQGKGVYKINSEEELFAKMALLKNESPSFVIREFIPNDGDIRVFTIGYKAIGAMKRTPPKGDFRSNISQGGTGTNFDLKKYPEVKQISEKLSKITRTEIAGVDVMMHAKTKAAYVLEINPGPQFTGFEKYTGVNVAGKIISYFERVAKKHD